MTTSTMTFYNHIKIFECNFEFSAEAITMHCISSGLLFTEEFVSYDNINNSPNYTYVGFVFESKCNESCLTSAN